MIGNLSGRLNRLEARIRPRENAHVRCLADDICDRRYRRLAAAGRTAEADRRTEHCDASDRPRTIGETIRRLRFGRPKTR